VARSGGDLAAALKDQPAVLAAATAAAQGGGGGGTGDGKGDGKGEGKGKGEGRGEDEGKGKGKGDGKGDGKGEGKDDGKGEEKGEGKAKGEGKGEGKAADKGKGKDGGKGKGKGKEGKGKGAPPPPGGPGAGPGGGKQKPNPKPLKPMRNVQVMTASLAPPRSLHTAHWRWDAVDHRTQPTQSTEDEMARSGRRCRRPASASRSGTPWRCGLRAARTSGVSCGGCGVPACIVRRARRADAAMAAGWQDEAALLDAAAIAQLTGLFHTEAAAGEEGAKAKKVVAKEAAPSFLDAKAEPPRHRLAPGRARPAALVGNVHPRALCAAHPPPPFPLGGAQRANNVGILISKCTFARALLPRTSSLCCAASGLGCNS
jgi:hypothetical protein